MSDASTREDKFVGICLAHHEAERLMQLALREAAEGMANGEIPIGALVARKSPQALQVLSVGRNRNIQMKGRIAHAELIALGMCGMQSFEAKGREKLRPSVPTLLGEDGEIVLVSTLEPCIMCFSAAIVAGVSTVIFALPSPADAGPGRVKMIDKATAVMPVVIGGVLESESRHLFEQWVSANKPGARHWEFVTKLLGITG